MTAEEIKALRIRLGLSQEKFGAEVGVSTQTVCHWETGKHKPKAEYNFELDLLNICSKPVVL